MPVQLRFINKSQVAKSPLVAISCLPPQPGVPIIAWKLIRDIGAGSFHPLTYSQKLEISVGDSDGNFTALIPAPPGSIFSAVNTGSGTQLVRDGDSRRPEAIEVHNRLPSGKITAVIFRDNSPCAQLQDMPPNTRTFFSFEPTLYIEKTASVQEGNISTIITFAEEPVRLPLRNIASADIILKGGGGAPFSFSLENIKRVS